MAKKKVNKESSITVKAEGSSFRAIIKNSKGKVIFETFSASKEQAIKVCEKWMSTHPKSRP